jgi:hypothetical protein
VLLTLDIRSIVAFKLKKFVSFDSESLILFLPHSSISFCTFASTHVGLGKLKNGK